MRLCGRAHRGRGGGALQRLFAELGPAGDEAMRAAGIKVDVRDDITPEDLEAVIADYDAFLAAA